MNVFDLYNCEGDMKEIKEADPRESQATYGITRITKDLQYRGIRVGHNRVLG